MALPMSERADHFGRDYRDMLTTLSEGSVHRNFDPYLDIDWDAPEFAIAPADPRWVLPDFDPLGATRWYRELPLDRQVEIGRWRIANSIKVGAAFESMLIRGLMQYIMKLPNGSPEFRYCLHEMTEECNHIQMFQELINRIGVDVPGMRPWFRRLSPFVGVAGGYLPVGLFIGILGGEEPIDHYQKSILREGANLPPAVVRCMEIHVAEEARHISFANEFLKVRAGKMSARQKTLSGIVFPIVLRWLAGEIMTPPRSFATEFGIPEDVFRQAFWRSPESQRILAGYFGDMRRLNEELGMMTPLSRRVWSALGISGPASRYRSEPERRSAAAA